MSILLVSVLSALVGCSSTPENPCPDDATVLVESDGDALTCAQAKIPTRYIRVLAGRPLPAGTTAKGVLHVKERFLADPDATTTWLQSMAKAAKAIETNPGLKGAELRSAEVYRAIKGTSPLGSEGVLWNLVEPALSVYATDDVEKLALTEVDMEAWITYASLCHEVQDRTVLSVSIAQRADVYQMLKERFEQGSRDEMVALASLGPVWPDIRERWQAASYEKQQAWIQAAPRPAALNASSLAYIETVVEGDLVGHARTMHAHFGPLHFRDGAGYFTP
jgi:hypothetical protein